MDSKQPLVSVIIIFLNEEKFLEEAIVSVIGQTYTNWELFLVDDGSSDNSTLIAKNFARKYPDQIYYRDHDKHQNQGMSASRNLGINQAQGEYIAFLDGDDIWLPRKLAREVAIMNANPEIALVSGQMKYWHSWTGKAEDQQRDFVPEYRIPVDTVMEPPHLLIRILKSEWAGLGCGFLIKKSIVRQVGGFEDLFKGMFEDQVFQAKLCLNFPVFISSEYWYVYRQHPESCCAVSQNTEEYLADLKMYLNWLQSYLSKQGVKNEEVWQLVRKELRPFRYPLLSYVIGLTRNLIQPGKRLFQKILSHS